MPGGPIPITSRAANRPGGRPRLLLLVPTRSYRARDFVTAAHALGVDVVVGTDQPHVLEQVADGASLSLDFGDPEGAAARIAEAAEGRPFRAIVPVDDGATAVAARAAERLGLPHNPPDAVWAARNKYRFRQRLAAAGLPSPEFRLVSVEDAPARLAREVAYPCVLKPLTLSMSRGVIRADGDNSFVEAFHRVAAIVAEADDAVGEAAGHMLVESYVPGTEYAVEGLIDRGRLHVLAVFDKPDPLEGPYFEETIYVTPARLDDARARAIAETAERAVAALGLAYGPTHIDLRVNDDGVFILEVDARSIGGYCGRSLRFGPGLRLEDVILRHAAAPDETPAVPPPAEGAGGAMMIPIPATGILRGVRGLAEAEAVPGVVDVAITIPKGRPVVMLPEGDRYLGFIIARAATPEDVVAALRRAHGHLAFDIEETGPAPAGA